MSGLQYARQKIAARFKFFLAEWFLDRREGVPYFRDVFVKNPDLRVIRSVFRQVLLSITTELGTPLVKSIPTFELVFTPATRSLAFAFQAVLDSGELLSVLPSDQLFIINDLADVAR
jgi:hypothetical protein